VLDGLSFCYTFRRTRPSPVCRLLRSVFLNEHDEVSNFENIRYLHKRWNTARCTAETTDWAAKSGELHIVKRLHSSFQLLLLLLLSFACLVFVLHD
jgi:hypothetical protein